MRLADPFVPLMAQVELFFGERPAGDGLSLRDKIDTLIDEARRAAIGDRFDADDVEAALFPVVVWIDEVAMNAEWEGNRKWKGAQLQRALYETSRGGELFFERLEALPPEKNNLREVYLLCLFMGFKGKYYLTPGRAVPDELIRRHLDLFLKSKEQGDIPSPLRLYIASSRIDVARKGGAILTEVPLFEEAYGDGEEKNSAPKRTRVMTKAMWMAAAAPVAFLASLYLVFDHQLADLVGGFLRTLGR